MRLYRNKSAKCFFFCVYVVYLYHTTTKSKYKQIMTTAINTQLTLRQIDKMFDVAQIVKTYDVVSVNYDCNDFYINASYCLSDGNSSCEIWTSDDDDKEYPLNDSQYNHVIRKLEKFNENNI